MRNDYYDEDGCGMEYDDCDLNYIFFSIYPEEDVELLKEIEEELND